MLINLVPDFLAVLESSDRVAAYYRYFEEHAPLLSAYWHNYVVDADSPHFSEVVVEAMAADRSDLRAMLAQVDPFRLARNAATQCEHLLNADSDVDVVMMVGVGAANAGELVVDGRGIAFVCLEHFTGVSNTETHGLGLEPELIPMWLAHEMTHAVRYTSPTSRAQIRQAIEESGGQYSFWETARRCSLRELLVNEGLAVRISEEVSPGHAAWEYFGYERRQYARIREMEPIISGLVSEELDASGIGLRMKYLSDGVNSEARVSGRHELPERSGYYMGARMVDAALSQFGAAWAVRASAEELDSASRKAAASA
jgi:hypothetical protein